MTSNSIYPKMCAIYCLLMLAGCVHWKPENQDFGCECFDEGLIHRPGSSIAISSLHSDGLLTHRIDLGRDGSVSLLDNWEDGTIDLIMVYQPTDSGMAVKEVFVRSNKEFRLVTEELLKRIQLYHGFSWLEDGLGGWAWDPCEDPLLEALNRKRPFYEHPLNMKFDWDRTPHR